MKIKKFRFSHNGGGSNDLYSRISRLRNSLSSEASDGNSSDGKEKVKKEDIAVTGEQVLVDKYTLGRWCSLLDDVLGVLDNVDEVSNKDQHINNVVDAARGYLITKAKNGARRGRGRQLPQTPTQKPYIGLR